jgi:hypothetical protein
VTETERPDDMQPTWQPTSLRCTVRLGVVVAAINAMTCKRCHAGSDQLLIVVERSDPQRDAVLDEIARSWTDAMKDRPRRGNPLPRCTLPDPHDVGPDHRRDNGPFHPGRRGAQTPIGGLGRNAGRGNLSGLM